jgi:hypothetical protein
MGGARQHPRPSNALAVDSPGLDAAQSAASRARRWRTDEIAGDSKKRLVATIRFEGPKHGLPIRRIRHHRLKPVGMGFATSSDAGRTQDLFYFTGYLLYFRSCIWRGARGIL